MVLEFTYKFMENILVLLFEVIIMIAANKENILFNIIIQIMFKE